MANMNTERVKFKLFQMPCCGQLLCWVNPRLPNYCPECGKSTVGGQLLKPTIQYQDDEAMLKYHDFQFMRGKVGTTEDAEKDTAYFQEAKRRLGNDADPSSLLRLAQDLKSRGETL